VSGRTTGAAQQHATVDYVRVHDVPCVCWSSQGKKGTRSGSEWRRCRKIASMDRSDRAADAHGRHPRTKCAWHTYLVIFNVCLVQRPPSLGDPSACPQARRPGICMQVPAARSNGDPAQHVASSHKEQRRVLAVIIHRLAEICSCSLCPSAPSSLSSSRPVVAIKNARHARDPAGDHVQQHGDWGSGVPGPGRAVGACVRACVRAQQWKERKDESATMCAEIASSCDVTAKRPCAGGDYTPSGVRIALPGSGHIPATSVRSMVQNLATCPT